MGTKNNPATFDCYANAEPDEPMFVLLARDGTAANAVRHWARVRVHTRRNKPTDDQIVEAYACADAMESWYLEHRA